MYINVCICMPKTVPHIQTAIISHEIGSTMDGHYYDVTKRVML